MASNLEALRAELARYVNDPATPSAHRTDAELTLEGVSQIIGRLPSGPAAVSAGSPAAGPSAGAGSWMGAPADPAIQTELEAPAGPAPVRRDQMLPLSGWMADTSVTVERLMRRVLEAEPVMLALVDTLKGVRPDTELGKALHLHTRAVVDWWLALRNTIVANG